MSLLASYKSRMDKGLAKLSDDLRDCVTYCRDTYNRSDKVDLATTIAKVKSGIIPTWNNGKLDESGHPVDVKVVEKTRKGKVQSHIHVNMLQTSPITWLGLEEYVKAGLLLDEHGNSIAWESDALVKSIVESQRLDVSDWLVKETKIATSAVQDRIDRERAETARVDRLLDLAAGTAAEKKQYRELISAAKKENPESGRSEIQKLAAVQLELSEMIDD